MFTPKVVLEFGVSVTSQSLTPTEDEGGEENRVIAKENWLQGIVQTKVETSVDENTDCRNCETTEESSNTVSRLNSVRNFF